MTRQVFLTYFLLAIVAAAQFAVAHHDAAHMFVHGFAVEASHHHSENEDGDGTSDRLCDVLQAASATAHAALTTDAVFVAAPVFEKAPAEPQGAVSLSRRHEVRANPRAPPFFLS